MSSFTRLISEQPCDFHSENETLQIRKGKHVDANGQVSVPYLDNWERKSEVRGLFPDSAYEFVADGGGFGFG
jgi:hypothetical protein